VFDYEEFEVMVPAEVDGDDCHPTESDSLNLRQGEQLGNLTDGKTVDGSLWKSATIWKFSVAAKLREIGETADADKLESCHSRRVMAQCNGCGDVQVFRNRCDQFFCPECQPKLARRRAEGVKWWTTQVTQPKHVVLTIRNIPELTKGHVLEFKKFLTRLRHRKFCSNWKAGFYSIEITNEGNGWHLHAHLLVDCRWVDAGGLSREWCSVTGGLGFIVKVKDCRQADYLREVTKYAVKGSELSKWTGAQIRQFIESFRGTKTFGTFGWLYGKRTEFREWLDSLKNGKSKCKCGSCDVTYYDENEWHARDLVPTSLRVARPPPPPSQLPFESIFNATRQIYR
jgi:hypothetical protein